MKADNLEYELSTVASNEFADALLCNLCKKKYDLSQRAPLLLPCGHNICSKEIEDQEDFRCPKCKEEYSGKSQYNLDVNLLKIIGEIEETLKCKKHQNKATHVCLKEKGFLCYICQEYSNNKEELKQFLEKMKETRRWRKNIERELEFDKEILTSLILAKRDEFLTKVEETLSREFLGKIKDEEMYAQIKAKADNYIIVFFQESLTKKIMDPNFLKIEAEFAKSTKILEQHITSELKDPIYNLNLEDLRIELERWTRNVDAQALVNGLKQKLNDMVLTFSKKKTGEYHDIPCYIEFKTKEFGDLAAKLVKEKHDLIEALSHGIRGIAYYKLRMYVEVESELNKGLELIKMFLGDEHPCVARCYYGLGLGYSAVGSPSKAIEFQKAALLVGNKALGEEHPDLADIYNAFGVAYRNEAKYDLALAAHQKAYDIRKSNFGENYPGIISCLNNIGIIMRYMNKNQKALELHKKALNIAINLYGDSHPDVADCYNCIGAVHTYENNTSEALNAHNSALQIRKKCFGKVHPDVAQTCNNIGIIYKNIQEHEKSLQYFTKALQIKIECFGENNTDVASCYSNISIVYTQMEKFKKALEYQQRALKIRKAVLGEEHVDIAKSYNNLGTTYLKIGDIDIARENFEKAYNLNVRLLGTDHIDSQKYKKNVEALWNKK